MWDKAEQADLTGYEQSDFAPAMRRFSDYMLSNGRAGFPPERIAAAVLTAVTAKKPAVRYAVVKGWFENHFLPAILPRRLIDRLIAREFGLSPAAR